MNIPPQSTTPHFGGITLIEMTKPNGELSHRRIEVSNKDNPTLAEDEVVLCKGSVDDAEIPTLSLGRFPQITELLNLLEAHADGCGFIPLPEHLRGALRAIAPQLKAAGQLSSEQATAYSEKADEADFAKLNFVGPHNGSGSTSKEWSFYSTDLLRQLGKL